MKKRSPVKVGSVFQICLPNGSYAYCRLYQDATIAVYRQASKAPDSPPIGSRDFLFQVGIQDKVLSRLFPLVGFDGFEKGESDWPEKTYILDDITDTYSVYHRGKIKAATKAECETLEEAAVWNAPQIVDRIVDQLRQEGLY